MSEVLSPSKKKVKVGLTSGLFGKVMDMVEHGLRKSTVFSGVPTADIDRFVKADGPALRDVWTAFLGKRFHDFIGRCVIPVDYGEPNAIAKAIDEGKFEWKYVGLAPESIPLVGAGKVNREVHEVPFDKIMYNCDLPNALKERGKELGYANGFKFADPLTALRYAATLPDRQRKYPLAILFTDVNGQLWYLYLHVNVTERGLNVSQDSPDNYWGGHVRFLAVLA